MRWDQRESMSPSIRALKNASHLQKVLQNRITPHRKPLIAHHPILGLRIALRRLHRWVTLHRSEETNQWEFQWSPSGAYKIEFVKKIS